MHKNQESGISNDMRRSPRKHEPVRPRKSKRHRPADQSDGYPAQLEAVIESVEEGLVVCDATGRVRRMNRRALEIHGYTSIEEAWRSLPEFADAFALHDSQGDSIPVEDWPLSRAVRGEVFRDEEVCVRNKRTGTEWLGRCDGTPVRDEQGNMVLTVLTLHELKEPADVAAQRQARQAERKFRAIFDSTSDGIFLLDLEARRFTMCNQSCVRMLGYTQEEFLNLSVPDLHLPADLPFIYAQMEKFLNGEKPIRHDIRFKRKDGSIVVADLSPDLVWLGGRRHVVVALKDVTERKRAEEALQKERDQARQYLRVAGVMMVALDAEGKVTLINEKGCEILGYRQEEILGRDWFEVCLPEEIRAEVTGVFNRLMAGDIAPVEYYENPIRRKDGQQRVVAFHNTVLHDPSAGIVGVLFSGGDITEHRQAEEALAASEEKYRSLVQNIPDVTWTTDRQGRTLFISPNVMDVYGYSAEEVCTGDDTWLRNVHPEDRPRIERAFHELFSKKKAYDVEYRIRRKDGTWIWLHDRSVSSYEKDGRWYADGVFSDITQRKHMEEELRRHTEHLEELVAARTAELQESETRYRSLYHTIADGIFVMALDGRIADVNDSACAQLGYTREELIGLPVSAVSARSDFNLGEVFDRLRATGSLSYETSHRRKDGTLVPVELSVTAVEYRGRPAILGVARDITKRKRAEEALQFTQFAIDHTADAAFWMTEDAQLFYVNEAACQALGYSREELLEMTVYDIDPAFTESMWRENWRRLKADKSIILETVHRARDGRVYPVEIRANYLEFGGRAYDCAFARDITERKRAEEALRESERMLRRSQEVAHVGHWSWDVKANRVTWSDEMYRIFGIEKSEFDGDPDKVINSAIHPEDRALVFSRMAATVEEGTTQPVEYRVVWPDGSIRRVRMEPSDREFDATGRTVRLSGIVQDTTDLKRTEEALWESEARYRLLLDRGFDGIFVHENFRIVQLNDRFVEMTGYARSELLGSKSIDLFTPDSQERIRQYIRSGAGGYFEIELRRRDGRLLQVEAFGAPCLFYGRSARIVGLRDITERKLAAQALREKEYLLTESQRIGHIGTWSVDLATNAATWTSETYRLFGVSPETFVPSAKTLLGLLHPDDRSAMQEWIRAAFAGEHPDALEFRVVFPDGSTRVLSGRGELIFNGNNEPVRLVGTAQDVTEQKQVEAFLRRLNEQLERQVAERTEDLTHTVGRLQQLTLELSQAEDRERKRIADILHDDVQQTLAAARFHLNLLGTETRGTEEAQEIVEQVRHMLRDAIEKSRSLSHELSPVLYQVDLAETLRWLACHMERKHGLAATVEAHGPVDSSSEPLKAFLYKVAQELLFNVVKHAGVKEARIRVRRLGRCIYLSVVDRGRGFDAQALEETAGFWLLGIRERVQLLGGRMKIKSAPGLGSRFLIEVPDQETSQTPSS
jgi:PAS domain S-box-containing protein